MTQAAQSQRYPLAGRLYRKGDLFRMVTLANKYASLNKEPLTVEKLCMLYDARQEWSKSYRRRKR